MTGAELRELLGELCAKLGTPGASVAVLAGGEVTAAASGVLNVETGVEATSDSLFQTGSIAKTWTSTIAMSLVDDGRLDLHTAVVDVIPGFRLADVRATAALTIRHLLTHSCGIDSDHMVDTGRGDDCVERYVATLPEATLLFQPGEIWSYSNSGFVVLGRVVEVLTGTTWDSAVVERITQPLGLARTATLPEDMLRHRVAYGHVGAPAELAPTWSLLRNFGPAGATLSTTATELARFGAAHLDGSLLSEASRAAMQSPHAVLPKGSHVPAWGLGWMLPDWDGTRVFGHDGGTIGQAATLRVLPEQGVVVALMLNSRTGADVFADTVLTEVLREYAVRPAPPIEPAPGAVPDLGEHLGRYGRAGMTLVLEAGDAGYRAVLQLEGVLAAALNANELQLPLAADAEGRVLSRLPGEQRWMPLVFGHFADGRPYALLGQALIKERG